MSDIEHISGNQADPGVPNPSSSSAFNVAITIPDQITIRMVDASALADYEVWVFISSLLSTTVVGFAVPFLQSIKSGDPLGGIYFWIALVFTFLFLVSIAKAITVRHQLKKKGREVKLRTTLDT